MLKLSLKSGIKKIRNIAIAMIATLSLAACVSPAPPTQELQAAESAIANAEQARVADFAGPELNAAREKLTAARSAVLQNDMVLAAYLANESAAAAQLASARTAMIKNKAVNDEMQENINILKQELQRNSGAR